MIRLQSLQPLSIRIILHNLAKSSTVILCKVKYGVDTLINFPYAPVMSRKRSGRPVKNAPVKPRRIVMPMSVNIPKMLARQKQQVVERNVVKAQQKRARHAIRVFRTRKADRGRIIMVSSLGKRNPQARGKKGYLVYVTKTGKKWLLKQKGQPLKPRPITQLTVPPTRLRKARDKFQEERRLLITHKQSKTRSVVKKSGEIQGETHLISKLTDSLTAALRGQESHRQFLITILARVALPDGSARVFRAFVDISRRDHVSIEKGGVRNFVRKKVWGFLATELGFAGFVSQGSANNIRRLTANKGLPREEWTNKRGDNWAGQDLETVKITHIEYKIEQLKK